MLYEVITESAGSATRVFDVSDVNNLKEISGNIEGSTLTIKRPAEELLEYVVFNSDGDFDEPEMVDEVANQNLHGLSTPEFLIISHPNFMTAAEELAAFHHDYDDMIEVRDRTLGACRAATIWAIMQPIEAPTMCAVSMSSAASGDSLPSTYTRRYPGKAIFMPVA